MPIKTFVVKLPQAMVHQTEKLTETLDDLDIRVNKVVGKGQITRSKDYKYGFHLTRVVEYSE